MKQIAFLSLGILFFIANTSCNKNNSFTPEVVDSLSSVLPKQIIWTSLDIHDSIYPMVISIKYDTLNHQIGLYRDDTANTNPYGHLLASYKYNNDGYLIKVTGINWVYSEFDTGEDITIQRAGDNKIISYVVGDPGTSLYDDSTYFYYKDTSTGTTVTEIKYYDRNAPQFNGITKCSYDNNFKIMSVIRPLGDSMLYTYNADNTLKKITSDIISESFSYTSQASGEKEDRLLKLLIGKDYYLPKLRSLYPFQFAGGLMRGYVFGIPATNPSRFTHISETGNPLFYESNGEAGLSYEYNEKGLLSKVTFKFNGDLNEEAVFKY